MFGAQEEEDLQQWMEGVPGPWSDQGWTSHVLIAVGGELEAWTQIFGWYPLEKKDDFLGKNADFMGFNHYKWWFDGDSPSGKLTVCYWKWPFIVDFPWKIVIFHGYVSLPQGNDG